MLPYTRSAICSVLDKRQSPHLSTRQYARIVDRWVGDIGLDVGAYGTHTSAEQKPL